MGTYHQMNVQIEEEHKQKIANIISTMKCPKGFVCYESGFQSLCKVKYIGLGFHVQCLETDPPGCKFMRPFGSSLLCACPVRVYIAKKLKK